MKQSWQLPRTSKRPFLSTITFSGSNEPKSNIQRLEKNHEGKKFVYLNDESHQPLQTNLCCISPSRSPSPHLYQHNTFFSTHSPPRGGAGGGGREEKKEIETLASLYLSSVWRSETFFTKPPLHTQILRPEIASSQRIGENGGKSS